MKITRDGHWSWLEDLHEFLTPLAFIVAVCLIVRFVCGPKAFQEMTAPPSAATQRP